MPNTATSLLYAEAGQELPQKSCWVKTSVLCVFLLKYHCFCSYWQKDWQLISSSVLLRVCIINTMNILEHCSGSFSIDAWLGADCILRML